MENTGLKRILAADGKTFERFFDIQYCSDLLANSNLVLIWGVSDFLCSFIQDQIILSWKSLYPRGELSSVENNNASDLSSMIDLAMQPSLISRQSLCVARNIQKTQHIQALSKRFPKGCRRDFCFLAKMIVAKSNPSLERELHKINAISIFCANPNRFNLIQIAEILAKRQRLSLERSQLDYLLDCCGDDLGKINNELNKISLVCDNEQGKRRVSNDEMARICTFLREDHIFEIDRLLLSKKFVEAELFLSELLERGESSLAVVGVIARHCRNAIKIHHNLSVRDSHKCAVQLPQAVLKSYNNYVVGCDGRKFRKALEVCHQIDFSTKRTNKVSDRFLLSKLVETLAHQ